MQKAAHLENVSEGGCWAELWEKSCFQADSLKHSSCSLWTVRRPWVKLILRWFCYFTFPTFRSPNLHLLLPMLLFMCDLSESTWDLSYKFCGKHRPVTLVLQNTFYSTLKFPEIKRKMFSFWDIYLRHHWKSSVLQGTFNCCSKCFCCLTSKVSIALLDISVVVFLIEEIKNS